MDLLIDPRAGSDKLIPKFPGECTSTMLDAGDIAFFGNGPDGDWFIGIEYKSVNDVVDCIKSGRLTGTQLPAMMELYDMCFLLVEGIPRPDPRTGQLLRYLGKSNSFPLGLTYQAYDNFLTSLSTFTSLAGKPCIVKSSGRFDETLSIIRNIHSLFSKPWNEHTAMKKPDMTKTSRVTFDFSLLREPEPDSPDYPKHILRKSVFQVDRVGWELAGKAAEYFGTIERAGAASLDEWKQVFGPVIASRVFTAWHGYEDQSSSRIERRNCDCFTTETLTVTGKPRAKPIRRYNKECPKCAGTRKFSMRIDTDVHGIQTETMVSPNG